MRKWLIYNLLLINIYYNWFGLLIRQSRVRVSHNPPFLLFISNILSFFNLLKFLTIFSGYCGRIPLNFSRVSLCWKILVLF